MGTGRVMGAEAREAEAGALHFGLDREMAQGARQR